MEDIHYSANEKNIKQAKLEDLQTYIEANNFKNFMIVKNKDYIIKDLQNQRDKTSNLYEKNIENQDFVNVLYKKIENDSQKIEELVTTKNELIIKIRELEQENRNIKIDYLKQEMEMKKIISRENMMRKQTEIKRVFEKLAECKVSDKFFENNLTIKLKLQESQPELLMFKENTESSYSDCLL